MSTIRLLIKPAIFTVGVCGSCFCGAAIIQHERMKSYPYNVPNFVWRRPATQSFSLPEWSQKQHHTLISYISELRRKANAWKNSLTTSEKIAFGTIFINLAVLGAWRIPALTPLMSKYFISHSAPSKIALSPMILSCFSHVTPLHFAFNMFCLYSFSSISTILLGPEQLIGVFISAGVVSSFVSLAHRIMTKRWVPSLGASGALLGVVAYVCVKQPDSRLLIFFIPVAASTALKAVIAIDSVGLMARWSFMDHAAHLGGSLFGTFYGLYGEQMYLKHRRYIIDTWHKFKRD